MVLEEEIPAFSAWIGPAPRHSRARMKVTWVSAEPAASPMMRSPCPLSAETIEFAISGRSVPTATTVSPMMPGGMLDVRDA